MIQHQLYCATKQKNGFVMVGAIHLAGNFFFIVNKSFGELYDDVCVSMDKSFLISFLKIKKINFSIFCKNSQQHITNKVNHNRLILRYFIQVHAFHNGVTSNYYNLKYHIKRISFAI